MIFYFHILKENFTIKTIYLPQRWRNHPAMALKEARATPKAVALDADLLKTNYLVRYQTGSLTKIKTGIFKDQGRSSMPAFLGLCPMPQNFWLLFLNGVPGYYRLLLLGSYIASHVYLASLTQMSGKCCSVGRTTLQLIHKEIVHKKLSIFPPSYWDQINTKLASFCRIISITGFSK